MLSTRFHTIDFTVDQLIIKESDIIQRLGYNQEQVDSYVMDIIHSMIEETKAISKPKGGLLWQQANLLEAKNGLIKAGGLSFNIGKIISKQLINAEFLVLFVCTLGDAAEKKCEYYFNENKSLEAYIMNLAASEAAENLAEQIHQLVREAAQKKNLKTTNRFSPGYCNWDVSEQSKLFSLLPIKNCGVELTASALMKPIKSVSGIIGVGTNAEFKQYACARCNDENCLYRNSGK